MKQINRSSLQLKVRSNHNKTKLKHQVLIKYNPNRFRNCLISPDIIKDKMAFDWFDSCILGGSYFFALCNRVRHFQTL